MTKYLPGEWNNKQRVAVIIVCTDADDWYAKELFKDFLCLHWAYIELNKQFENCSYI